MRLHILHDTRYRYTPPVETAQHIVHLRPRDLPYQQVLQHRLQIEPEPAQLGTATDTFGNQRTFFSLQGRHTKLQVLAASVVQTTAVDTAASLTACDIPWEQARERFRFHAGAAYDPAAEFVFASPYVPRHPDFAAYARPSFAAGTPLFAAAHDLMQRIHRDFTYEAESTQVNTPALQALAQRKGVCQDFAHIMVACLRSLGLSARYVSGYLLTEPPPGQPRLLGSDASHAWASVYLPAAADAHDAPAAGAVWCDFDPTNQRCPGPDYVTLAIGRDFGDVSPMRGVIHGGASHTLSVAVTVAPLEADL